MDGPPFAYIDHVMSEQPRERRKLSTNKPQRVDNESTHHDAPDRRRQNGRFETIAFLLLAFGCFGGAFFCARTIEFAGGYHTTANLIFQIPAMLGALGLGVLGFMFFFLSAD